MKKLPSMKKFIHKTLQGLIVILVITTVGVKAKAQQVQTGKSYINITKGTNGGTFEPGDTLEIRSAIAVGNTSAIYNVRYNDTIDNNFTYIAGTLKIITNEGLTFRAFTDAANDDNAMYDPINKNLRINLGNTATKALNTLNAATSGGTINFNDKPSFYGKLCTMVASYRIKINNTVPFNSFINLPGGAFRYYTASPVVANFNAYKIAVFKNMGSCSNFIGGNAIVENNGSFGSGTVQNRVSSAIVPGYTFINFSSGSPNDGYYGICNNSSASGATNNSLSAPSSTRVFSAWDIIGDHTGATDQNLGNPPAPVGTVGGYMAVVNASYATSNAIKQDVTGLCSNTYYDFSAWFRNICRSCSCDSNGNSVNAPGVTPNLTYQIDGIDYYTTGNLSYTGLWAKRGFTFLTAAAQNKFTLTIRNNSPGAGGNDWAVDDVNLATCEPNVDLNITPELLGCPGTQVNFNVTVKCYYPSYTYYKWQKSIDNGSSWLDTGVFGNGTPTLINGQYTYTANYPSFVATSIDSGTRYRVLTATNAANLAATGCGYSNSKNTILKIVNCAKLLEVQLVNFKGKLHNNKTNLQWSSEYEKNFSHYEIEKSKDGLHFASIGDVKGRSNIITTQYDFRDEETNLAPVYYRLKQIDLQGLFKYSEIIVISNNSEPLTVLDLNNPFRNSLDLKYTLPAIGMVDCIIADTYGKTICKQQYNGKKGINTATINNLANLSSGMYTITFLYQNTTITKRIIKIN